jgi:hypothetical protein
VSDWIDEAVARFVNRYGAVEDVAGALRSALLAAERRGRVEGMRHAADIVDTYRDYGIASDIRAAAEKLERGAKTKTT